MRCRGIRARTDNVSEISGAPSDSRSMATGRWSFSRSPGADATSPIPRQHGPCGSPSGGFFSRRLAKAAPVELLRFGDPVLAKGSEVAADADVGMAGGLVQLVARDLLSAWHSL